MATACPGCGTTTTDAPRVCAACGWDFVLKRKGNPAGLDMLFKPGDLPPPPPPPVEFVDTHAPVDPFAEITRQKKAAAEPRAPAWLPEPLLQALLRNESGKRFVDAILKDPRSFLMKAGGVLVLAAVGLYFLLRTPPPPPPPPAPPPVSDEYVRPAATFAAAPKAVVLSAPAPVAVSTPSAK